MAGIFWHSSRDKLRLLKPASPFFFNESEIKNFQTLCENIDQWVSIQPFKQCKDQTITYWWIVFCSSYKSGYGRPHKLCYIRIFCTEKTSKIVDKYFIYLQKERKRLFTAFTLFTL